MCFCQVNSMFVKIWHRNLLLCLYASSPPVLVYPAHGNYLNIPHFKNTHFYLSLRAPNGVHPFLLTPFLPSVGYWPFFKCLCISHFSVPPSTCLLPIRCHIFPPMFSQPRKINKCQGCYCVAFSSTVVNCLLQKEFQRTHPNQGFGWSWQKSLCHNNPNSPIIDYKLYNVIKCIHNYLSCFAFLISRSTIWLRFQYVSICQW